MRKKISDKQKIIFAFLILLFLSIISDVTQDSIIKDGKITRAEIGGKAEEVKLQLDVNGIVQEYSIEVLATQPTKEDAEKYFAIAMGEIDVDIGNLEDGLIKRDSYADGKVEAVWNFLPYGFINTKGEIRYDKLDADGEQIEARVTLSCGKYERLYQFSFLLLPKEMTGKEETMQQLDNYLKEQMETEGSSQIELPTMLGDTTLRWSKKKEYRTPKILLLEVVALILIWFAAIEKRKKDEQKRILKMEKEYPDIVNQLSFLLGAGMTIRQAWNRISVQYVFKKKEKLLAENLVYEAILRMNRKFSEGESEREIYQQFMMEIPARSYRKLMRMLAGSTEKGMVGICERLEEEGRQAYEQRVLQAKKEGEEASAKMLIPLMLMLIVVMGIVILPALIGFQM